MENREHTSPLAAMPEGASLRTLLLSDLVRSTSLVEELGDARAAKLFRMHDRVARNLLKEHDGLEIDKTDGFLMLFKRPWQAVLYALAYHRALKELSRAEGLELAARVGIHLGEVMLHSNKPEDVARGAKPLEVEGLAKPTAARLMSLARAGQTLLTRGAFDLARRSAVGDPASAEGLSWLAHGGYLFKGVQEPIDVFEVGEEGVAALAAPESSAKVKRVVGSDSLGWRPEAAARPAAGGPAEVRVGSVLGNYEILGGLGAGGMGEVFLARDNNLKRKVALKVLKPEMAADATRLARFQREAEAVASLNHPNIVTLFSVEEDRGTRFFTMELVKGERLDRIIPKAGLALEKLFNIALKLADAVASAHRGGIAHRDLKAANVMVTPEGRVKILDFGLAKLLDDEELGKLSGVRSVESLSAVGLVMGTVPYMSPEQVSGKTVDHRSDIFSLGVLMFEMSLGQRPFSGDSTADLVASILRDTPSDVTELRSDIPDHLGRIIQRCLEKDPEERYQSATDLLGELEGLKAQVLSGETTVATTAARLRPTPSDARPKRLPMIAASVLAASLLVIAGIWALRGGNGSREAGSENGGEASVSAATPPAASGLPAANIPSSSAGSALPSTSEALAGEEATPPPEPSVAAQTRPVETEKPEPKTSAPPASRPSDTPPPAPVRIPPAATSPPPDEPSRPIEAERTSQPESSAEESQVTPRGDPSPVSSPPPPAATAPRRDPLPVPPAPPPAEARPVVAVEQEKEAVARTLRQYESAMEALDAAAVKKVWPGVDEARERKSFSELSAQELDLECEVRISDDRATATCQTTMRRERKRGFARPVEFIWVFLLEKRDGSWIITGREASSS